MHRLRPDPGMGNPIAVGISRSGKRTVEKTGPDLIEAWNRRHACENLCDLPNHLAAIRNLPDCNDCGAGRGCQYRPQPGETVRINCPLWRAMEE